MIKFTIDTLFACTCIYLEEVLKGQCKGRPRNFKMRKGGGVFRKMIRKKKYKMYKIFHGCVHVKINRNTTQF